jgi:hypothetical protein
MEIVLGAEVSVVPNGLLKRRLTKLTAALPGT